MNAVNRLIAFVLKPVPNGGILIGSRQSNLNINCIFLAVIALVRNNVREHRKESDEELSYQLFHHLFSLLKYLDLRFCFARQACGTKIRPCHSF